jgi:succinate dehydrogenase / fumarate reductase cytochrome b subunit
VNTLTLAERVERGGGNARHHLSSRTALAVSGFVMLGYVLVHMAGNLVAFAGSATFDAYAHGLRELGTPLVGASAVLWAVRVVLAAALFTHLAAHAYRLFHPGSDATSYAGLPPWYATLPLAWLAASGALIAIFVAFHLAQLTIGATHPAFVPDDPYHNLVVALSSWPTALGYVGVAIAVSAHLLPGIWTGMQTLGLIRPGTRVLAGRLSALIPLVLMLGLSAVPIAVLGGVLR